MCPACIVSAFWVVSSVVAGTTIAGALVRMLRPKPRAERNARPAQDGDSP
jgi:hypothetical protein